ncbi:hypothetical protein [Streptomyces sp. NPDC101234]|uniref:hypothetical protein n=1 Tax=Streptomyces sp. NPDC101234 TaxID=3366138 RepID=UPI0037F52B24
MSSAVRVHSGGAALGGALPLALTGTAVPAAAAPAPRADGRHVAFASAAGNLVPGDTNGVDDIFVRHLG